MKARVIVYFLIAILFITQGVIFYYALDLVFYIIGGSVVVFFIGAGLMSIKRKETVPLTLQKIKEDAEKEVKKKVKPRRDQLGF